MYLVGRSKHVNHPGRDVLCRSRHSPVGRAESEQDPEIRQIGIDDSFAPQPGWLLGLKYSVAHQEQGDEQRSSERGQEELAMGGDEESRAGGKESPADVVGDWGQ